MYGLKQAAILAYEQLVHHRAPLGYYPLPNATGIWKHTTKKTIFSLYVDDFSIKSFPQADTDHLINALKQLYKVSIDPHEKNYCGLEIDWNYEKNYVDIAMPSYIDKVLHKFNHPTPTRTQHAPHQWTIPVYGKHRQYAPPDDTMPTLDAKATKEIQAIVGSLLYYTRAIESPMLTALNDITATQAHPTAKTKEKPKCSSIMPPLTNTKKFVIMPVT